MTAPRPTPERLSESEKATLAAGMAKHETQKAASARLRYLEDELPTLEECRRRLHAVVEHLVVNLHRLDAVGTECLNICSTDRALSPSSPDDATTEKE